MGETEEAGVSYPLTGVAALDIVVLVRGELCREDVEDRGETGRFVGNELKLCRDFPRLDTMTSAVDAGSSCKRPLREAVHPGRPGTHKRLSTDR